MSRMLATIVLLFLVVLSSISQTTRRVPQDHATIQAAINAAVNGDTVLVAEGTYKENLLLLKKIVLASLFLTDGDTAHISRTILDGTMPRHPDSASVITIDGATDTTTVIAGFTFVSGQGNFKWVVEGSSTVAYRFGFAIDVAGGGARIRKNIIRNANLNATVRLGGMINVWDLSDPDGVSMVIIEENEIADNRLTSTTSVEGGALSLGHNCLVSGNRFLRNIITSSASFGAVAQSWQGSIRFVRNLIMGNSSSHYGGVVQINAITGWASPHLTFENNIIANNSAGVQGGVIYATGVGVYVHCVNNTMVGNTAPTGACARVSSSARVRFLNTIIWNTGPEEDFLVGSGSAATLRYCVVKTASGTGTCIPSDPLFVVGDTLYRLQDTSPCINSGSASYSVDGVVLNAPTTDYFGHPRPFPYDSKPDMGAIESEGGKGTLRVPQDYATIQAAVNAASNGDTVLVEEGTYKENLLVNKKIVLASLVLHDNDTSHISRTILDGSTPRHADSGSVILLTSGSDTTTVIRGFTITKGTGSITQWKGNYNQRYGGGISILNGGGAKIVQNIIANNTVRPPAGGLGGAGGINVSSDGVTPTSNWVIIEDNTVENNAVLTVSDTTEVGGIGIWCTNVRIARNVIRNNFVVTTLAAAGLGGGILAYSATDDAGNDTVLITDNIVSGNTARYGAGISVAGNALKCIVQRNIIQGNAAIYAGGGLVLGGGLSGALISSNYISDNTAPRGGGIRTFSLTQPSTIVNNIITRNQASVNGRAVSLHASQNVQLVNNTIAFNASSAVTAFWLGGSVSEGYSSLRGMNLIIWDSVGSPFTNSNSSISLGYSLVRNGYAGTGNISSDPQFVVGDTLYHLQNTSPCIGAGAAAATVGGVLLTAPDHDFDGGPTIIKDIGAQSYPTGVEDLQQVPSTYALEQNFPNPFNPTTTIRFALPHESTVRLTIYNLLGQKIEELVNEQLTPGVKQVTWDAKVPTGVYLYRLDVVGMNGERYTETRRMTVLR